MSGNWKSTGMVPSLKSWLSGLIALSLLPMSFASAAEKSAYHLAPETPKVDSSANPSPAAAPAPGHGAQPRSSEQARSDPAVADEHSAPEEQIKALLRQA